MKDIYLFRSHLPWWKKKKFLIPLILVLILVIIRLILPTVLLQVINYQGARVSPLYLVRADDLSLSLLKANLTLEDLTVRLKSNNRKFLEVKEIEVHSSWWEVFQGQPLLNVVVENFHLMVAQDLVSSVKQLPKDDKPKKAPPVQVEWVDIKSSTVTLLEYPGIGDQKNLTLTNIQGRLSNPTAREDFPYTYYNLQATFLGESDLNIVGKLNLWADPIEWSVDSEFKNFQLPKANDLLRSQIPVSFVKGKMDVFMEAKAENNKIKGYIKPFLDNVEVMGNKQEFLGAKHFFVEVLGAVGSFIFKDNKTESLATKIPFVFDEKLKIDSSEAIDKIIQHGFDQNLKRGIDNQFELK